MIKWLVDNKWPDLSYVTVYSVFQAKYDVKTLSFENCSEFVPNNDPV